MEQINEVSLYPNPATTKVKVTSREMMKAITITTIAGREVLRRNDLNKTDESIPVTLLPEGLYHVKVVTEKNTFTSLLYKAVSSAKA